MDIANFIPVRGNEQKILAEPYKDGQLYFAIDTKAIYMDADGQNKIPMGSGSSSSSGSGIIFGSKTITSEEEAETTISFKLSELSIDYLPTVDAVILNTPDGCFYRITEVVSDTDIQALRLTVAGGGGGGSDDSVTLTLEIVSGINTGSTFVYGQPADVVFKGNVDNDDTRMIYQIEIINTYAAKTTTKTYGPFQGDKNVNYTFDLGSVLPLGANTVKFSVSSDNAGKTKTISKTLISCVEMYLEESDNFNPLMFKNAPFNYLCIPVGEGLSKTVQIYIDDVLYPDLTKTGITDKNTEQSFAIPALRHGMHTIKAVLTCAESTATTSIDCNICYVANGETEPIIWYNADLPSKIVNHDILTIEYMVYNPVSTVGQETHFYINSAEIATSPMEVDYSSSQWLKWRVIGYTVGDNTFTISCGNTSLQIPMVVEVDTKRNLDIFNNNLHVNLTAVGRSNNENTQSRSTWTSTSTFDNSTTSVNFSNFNWYNNGWITDDDGETCLRISNGASISIPLTGVLNTRQLSDSLAFEFVFKVRNVGHYGTLINTEVSDTDSDSATVTKTVSSTEGVWGSFYKNSIGFCLGTQEAFFKTKNALVSGRFKENEKVHLTFVVEAAGANSNNNKLLYIYINGINSGITKYNTSTDSLLSNCTALTINSEYCDIDLYNLRIYKTNLTAERVIQNYLADYNDAQLYDMNQDIVSYSNGVPYIQYLDMCTYNDEHPEALLMPYMLVETVANDDQLPYYKCEQDVPWQVNIHWVNPELDYMYSEGLITEDVLNNYGFSSADEMYALNAPSFEAEGVEINVQGTSSQGYPIRNFKIKLKNATKWNYTLLKDADGKVLKVSKGGTTKAGYSVKKKFHTWNTPIGENKYTLKADYMDSSGVHNSGFANLVGNMYSKHPIQDYGFDADEANQHRTSVYGFPYLMFQKLHTGTGNAQYKFLGRYNMNVDKGCDDTFGFCDYGDDTYVDVTNLVNTNNFDASKLYIYDSATEEYTCVADSVAEDETAVYSPTSSYYRLDEGADSNALNPDYDATDPYSRKYYPWSRAAECWEMQHNQGGRCSFKKSNFEELNSSGVLSVLSDYEYRYHADADSIDNCLNRDHYKEDGEDFSGATNEQVNAYMLEKLSRFEKLVDWLVSTDASGATNETLTPSVTYGDTVYTEDNAAYRLAKFKYEFDKWLDKEYCMIYWIMTELLLCYDSRGKNLMMATWGPQVKGGNDIWYPIFYDIDTQLGVNNSGVPYWDYYEEATDNGTFSTADSVLWNNLWNVFQSDIKAKFNALTGNQLTIDKINGAYSFDPVINQSMAMSGYRPMITVNVDEYQKYIAPSISGYTNTANQTVVSDAFYYCLQGTRELQRQMFLRNRFNYISSKWQGGDYYLTKVKQGVQMRFDANDYPNTSDKYLNTTNELKYFSQPKTVGSVGKIDIISQATYDEVKSKSKDGKIYIKNAAGTYDEDTSGTYDGSKASDYYIKNDYEYAAYPHALDFVWDFDVTPYLKQYVSNYWDDTPLPVTYASDGETVTIAIPDNKFDDVMNTANYPQQLVYFGGAEYLSSLGDLSKKYIDQLWISGAYRLKDLLVGSDVPGYWNNMMNTNSFKPDDTATITVDGVTKTNPNAKSLLERVILTNLGGLTDTIDFSGSEKLKELRALGTKVSSFILADGVQIAKLYLPETVTNLILKEPTSLTGILTSPDPNSTEVVEYNVTTVTEDNYDVSIHYINTIDGYKRCDDATYFASAEIAPDYPDFDEESGLPYNETRTYYTKSTTTKNVYPDGLYIAGLTNLTTIDENSKIFLDTIDIVGGNMGYDSYTLLNKAVQVKEQMISASNLDNNYDKHLAVNIENVDWTPYRQLAEGETAVEGKTYYKMDDHDFLTLYNKVSNEYPQWALNVANGMVYEYDADEFTAHASDIVNIDLLDTFINDYQAAKDIYDALDNKSNFDSDNYNYYKSTDNYAQGPTLAKLTGTIYINNSSDNPIEESKIKNYYNKTGYYPKLNIQVANITKANVVKFVQITNETTGQEYVWDTIKYPVSGTGSQNYPDLTTVQPSKIDYDFKGWTKDIYTQAQIDAMTDDEVDAILLDADSVKTLLFSSATDRVIRIYAVFVVHSYQITYKYPSDVQDGATIQVVAAPSSKNLPVPTIVPWKDSSSLLFEETYKLVGYATVENASAAEIIPYVTGDTTHLSIKSTRDMTLYAIFDTASVYDNVIDTNYLTFSSIYGGYEVSLNTDYMIRGKITLPSVYNGENVIRIANSGFAWTGVSGRTNYITHIFFDNGQDNYVEAVGEAAFMYDEDLLYVQFNPNLSIDVDVNAFNKCKNLFNGEFKRLVDGATNATDVKDSIMKDFFHSFHTVGMNGFRYCTNLSKVYIGAQMNRLDNTSFANCTALNYIEIGEPDKDLGINASACGRNIFQNSASAGSCIYYLGTTDSSVWTTLNSSCLALPADWSISQGG